MNYITYHIYESYITYHILHIILHIIYMRHTSLDIIMKSLPMSQHLFPCSKLDVTVPTFILLVVYIMTTGYVLSQVGFISIGITTIWAYDILFVVMYMVYMVFEMYLQYYIIIIIIVLDMYC